jgi:hypothetical protein
VDEPAIEKIDDLLAKFVAARALLCQFFKPTETDII